jgi:protein SCO1
MRRRLAISLALAVLATAGLGYVAIAPHVLGPPASAAQAAAIGGPFQLMDQDGHWISDRDLRGKPTLMVFGFTHCPDVCPMILSGISRWLARLGPDADRLNVVFVTVDPARDTPAKLKLYLSSFDPRIRGLTGSEQQIVDISSKYKVFIHKELLPGGDYTVDHSSVIYLFDRDGQFVGPIVYGQTEGSALKKIRLAISRNRNP